VGRDEVSCVAIRYFGGIEINFEDRELCKAFLATQGIDRKGFDFFRTIHSALEMHTFGDKMLACYECSRDQYDRETRDLVAENLQLPLSDWEEHGLFFLEKDKRGPHRIGGAKPLRLELPKHERLRNPFQYIGSIQCSDKHFNWIPLDTFHIVYPLHQLNFGIFLDYSNAERPKLVDPVSFPDGEQEENPRLDLEFLETRYVTTTKADFAKHDNRTQLLCGVPMWIQAPEIPVSPITGDLMRFVARIKSDPAVVVTHAVEPVKPYADDHLIFYDEGSLYVFFEARTRLAHVNVQF